MKRFLVALMLMASSALFGEINQPAYEVGYKTYTIIGNTPVLSQYVDYENAQWLPSVLPELGSGWVYIDNNGQLGGVIFPILDRKLFMHVFIEYDPNEATYTRNSPRQLLNAMRGTVYDNLGNDDYIAPLSNIFGFGFAGDAGLLSWGINMKLYADQYSRETKAGATETKLANATFRLELTPSVSMKMDSWRMDAGLNFLYQWISNETSTPSFTYPYDYSGNAEFSVYGRAMFDVSKFTTLMGALSFGYAGAADKMANDTMSLDNTYLAAKMGVLVKPIERLTLGSNFLFYHCWGGLENKVTAGGATTTNQNDGHLILFNFTQTADFKVAEWFTLKAGIGKDIFVNTGTAKVITAAATATADSYDNNFDIGKFIGFGIDYKEFNLTALMNFDILTEGPDFISGRGPWVNPMAFMATIHYRW